MKIFSLEQVRTIENYHLARLKKSDERAERAEELVNGLTQQLNQKNEEIHKLTFYVEALTTALTLSCQAIEILRTQKAN